MQNCDVAVIGAGPYGLSIAAYLKKYGLDFRIFGKPMGFWTGHMPKGMHLKSEGFASSLFEPSGSFTLGAYCREHLLPYADLGRPVPLDVFSSYGLEFQRRFVPELETQKVQSVAAAHGGFRVTLEDGETFNARRVVVAVGQSYFPYLPPVLAAAPRRLLTHSSEHSALDAFAGKQLAIIGAGASALDLAALLHQAGAEVTVVARGRTIRFHDPDDTTTPTWRQQLAAPVTGIGPGWKLWLCANLPTVFRRMPEQFRVDKVRKILGPAPCWFIREQVEGKVSFDLGSTPEGVTEENGRARLQLIDDTGHRKSLHVDHVIAATGFRTDLDRIDILDGALRSLLHRVDASPALSSHFESSVPGLYFVGVTAANTFGPLLRFAVGAGFAAPRLARHLRRSARTAAGARLP